MVDVHDLDPKSEGATALEGHCGVCGESMFTIGSDVASLVEDVEQVASAERAEREVYAS
jgi:hypothetical protein